MKKKPGTAPVLEVPAEARLLALVERARTILPASTAVLVNGRVDVALAAGADGVHLPSDSLPASEIRRRFGGGILIGVSTHRFEEVVAAREAGADYVTFGPVWPTRPVKHAEERRRRREERRRERERGEREEQPGPDRPGGIDEYA